MKIDDLLIFVFHYKPESKIINIDNYIHIWAGKNKSLSSTELLGDDTGNNISHKNKYYSELSGIYWAWKNRHANIVGSCHYRRFFTNKNEPILYKLKRRLYYLIGLFRKRFGLIYTNNVEFFEKRIITKSEILEILKSYDVILPQSRRFRYTVKEHYRKYHDLRDLDIIKEILNEKYPEYIYDFECVMNSNSFYANNMFIFRKPDFDRLMEWWFEILFEFENRINKAEYIGYQQRIMGFIAERLLTIWVHHQNFRIKELPVIYFKKFKSR